MAGDRPLIYLIAKNWRERTLIRAQLMEEGYDVDGLEGLEDLVEGRKPDLIIFNTLDQPSPKEGISRLRDLYPTTPLLVIAGTLEAEMEGIGIIPLHRPLSIGDLCQRVRSLLRRPGQQGRRDVQRP